MVRSKQAVSIDRNSPSTGSGSKVQMGIANRGLRTYSQSQYRNNKRRESIASSAAFSRLGQQEALKHDKMMKLRKHQQHLQQLRSSNHENGKLKTAAAFVLRSGAQDRSASPQLVKRSVNPRKAAVVVAAAAATAAQSESESTSPNDDSHSTSGLQNGVENSSGAAKLKINVEFEDTDDDEENEGLKKVMENIEKDLNVAEDLKKGLLTKRSHAPSAPVNESWLEFGDKSAKKIKGMSRTDGNDSAKHDSEMVLTKLRENELKDCNGDDHSTVSAGLQDGQVEFKSPSDVSVDTDSSKDMKRRSKKKVLKKSQGKDETVAVKVKEVPEKLGESNKVEGEDGGRANQGSGNTRTPWVKQADRGVITKDSSNSRPERSQTLKCGAGQHPKGECESDKQVNDDENIDKSETILNLQLEVSDESDPRLCDSNDDDDEEEVAENENDSERVKTKRKEDLDVRSVDDCDTEVDSSHVSRETVLGDSEVLVNTGISDSLDGNVTDKKTQSGVLESVSTKVPSLKSVVCNTEKSVVEVKGGAKRKTSSDCDDGDKTSIEKKLKSDAVKDEFKTTESSPVPLLPIMTDVHDDKKKEPTYRLTKSELEMLVICKVSEYFTDANKSEIGVLRRRCEQFDKIIDQWRRKANLYQKQITDLQIALQRAQTHRRFMGHVAPKPPMRSVGLQVQLTRYVHADSSKLIPRTPTAPLHPQKQNALGHHPPTFPNQPVVLPKQVSASQMAFVTNLGSTGALNGATLVTKGTSVGHVSGSTSTHSATVSKIRNQVPIVQKAPGATSKSPGSQVGQVSLLQPRTPTNVVITTQLPSANLTSSSGTINASSPSKLRTALDPAKMNASNSTPVPMRLVPNQAVTRQLAPSSSASTTSSTVTNANSRAVTVSMIGQPPVVTNAVKIIDLTADEEESAKAAAAAAAAVVSSTSVSQSSSTTSSSSGGVNPVSTLSNVAMVSSSLPSGSNTVTMLTPATSGNQILTLASPVGGMVTGTTTVTTQSHIRMAQPVRAGNASIVNSGPVRLAYLMSPTSMVTMVRPNQPLFVAPSPGVRPGQPSIMRPALPTIVLQRGTTLLPLQQSQVTSLPNLRPTSATQSPRASAPAQAVVPVSVIGAPTVLRPALSTAPASSQGSSSTSLMNVAAAMVSGTPPITYSRTTVGAPSSLQSTKNVPVTKTVITPQPPKHPAPLPPMATYPEVPGRKAIPSKPTLRLNKVTNGIVLSWNMTHSSTLHAEISSYQLYAYQEGSSPPSTQLWKKVGDVKALPLPMACTLTQFMEGHKYYFAVRAMDIHNRLGPFSDPGGIALLSSSQANKSSGSKS